MKDQATYDKIIRSRIQMLIKMPFFGILSLNLSLSESETIPTAATDGKVLYYNPEFIKKLSEAEINFIMVHEVLHPALKHLWRRKDRQMLPWNCACDFAINAIILDYAKLNDPNSLKMPEKGLYDKKYDGMSAEEIYDTFDKVTVSIMNKGEGDGKGNNLIDDHSIWNDANQGADGDQEAADWEGKLISAAEQASNNKNAGKMPAGLKRLLDKITKPQKDWRTLLNEFIIEFVNDYSFNPPDRRYSDNEFFLPEFNEVDQEVKDIVFWIDTSGSISHDVLQKIGSEIIGAIQQMNGKLQGYVGYFDHSAYPLVPFESVQDILNSQPKGGGGTSFHAPFIRTKEQLLDDDHEVAGIIMLTDGYAEFPDESLAEDIPTLWVITNEQVKPTFGLHTTIKV